MPTKTSHPADLLRSTFLTHPHAVGETYFQHLRAAMGFAGFLAVTALAAMVHALVPSLCETTARRRISVLHDRLQKRVPDNAVNAEATD
ncbi:MAG: DUF6356 family protein [Pseudomonadota bacterium]